MDSVRVAAVQFEGVAGDVAENLRRLTPLIREAVDAGAEVVALPEFLTSPVVFRSEVHQSVLTPENPALELLRDLARRYGISLGGSMLIADGDRIYNRYHLVEADGTVHLHDKDLPTMWENAFYGPGHDDGVVSTGRGRVGLAVCWELIRNRTARRMIGRVDLVLTGTHWWTVPTNWGPVGRLLGAVGKKNRRLSEDAPSQLARRLGVPVIQASHCGEFTTGLSLIPGVSATLPYRTHYVGSTQIVDGDGRVLASRSTADGPGVVVAEVTPGARMPTEEIGHRFWTPRLPWVMRAYWWQQNACATRYYRDTGRSAGLAAARAGAAAPGTRS